jgi:hypothetical protein
MYVRNYRVEEVHQTSKFEEKVGDETTRRWSWVAKTAQGSSVDVNPT